jgi:dihydropteroate synthase
VECAEAGADIVDIGGESTRPGFQAVPVEEELGRVMPVLRGAREAVALPLSIDTTKWEVAQQALEAGASVLNDVSGRTSPEMLSLAARTGAGLVLVHQGKGEPGEDVVEVVLRDLEAAIDRAVRQGVSAGAILIDPGLGFGKTWRENFAILRRLATLRSLGYPILVGPSRKGMIGKVLGVRVKDRMEGTLALVTIAVAAGADMVRVHDVREMARAARMADALAR